MGKEVKWEDILERETEGAWEAAGVVAGCIGGN